MFELDDDIMRQLRATFKIEAAEHIQAMNRVLLALEDNPDSDEHGYMAKDGHHEGDMPNLTVLPDGTLNTEIFNEEAELDEMVVDNGTALMIHEKADDYTTQPSGNAGGRIACAVVK